MIGKDIPSYLILRFKIQHNFVFSGAVHVVFFVVNGTLLV